MGRYIQDSRWADNVWRREQEMRQAFSDTYGVVWSKYYRDDFGWMRGKIGDWVLWYNPDRRCNNYGHISFSFYDKVERNGITYTYTYGFRDHWSAFMPNAISSLDDYHDNGRDEWIKFLYNCYQQKNIPTETSVKLSKVIIEQM